VGTGLELGLKVHYCGRTPPHDNRSRINAPSNCRHQNRATNGARLEDRILQSKTTDSLITNGD